MRLNSILIALKIKLITQNIVPKIDTNIIIDNNITSCHNCKHLQLYYHKNNCSKFSKKNIVTNIVEYISAIDCRNDENKCGINANHFIHMTDDEYNQKNNDNIIYSYIIVSSIILSYVFIIANKNLFTRTN